MDFAEGNGACSMADSPAPAHPGPEQARTKARKQLSKSQASFKLQTKDVAGGAGMQGKRGSACGCSGTLVFPLYLYPSCSYSLSLTLSRFWSVFMSSFAYFVSIFAFYIAFCLCSRRMSTTNV